MEPARSGSGRSQGSGPKNVTGKRKQLDCGGELGLDMLDLLGRWSSEDGEEDLIDAVVVESTVGEVMVGALIVGGFLVVVSLARVSASGTTAAGTPGVSPSGSKGRAESAFDMGKVVAKVATVESAASAVEARLMLCFALLAVSVISGRSS